MLDLKTIAKFAQMEYKLGDAERGKTIFEGIIDSHPKRLDLWSVYVDMEVGQKDMQSIRCSPCSLPIMVLLKTALQGNFRSIISSEAVQ